MKQIAIVLFLLLSVGVARAQGGGSTLLDGVSAALENARQIQQSLAVPDERKIKILDKLLDALAEPITSTKAELGLLKKIAGAAEKQLDGDVALSMAVNDVLRANEDVARIAIENAREHIATADPGKLKEKAQKALDKAETRLEQALERTSAKSMVGAISKASGAATKAQGQSHEASYNGPSSPTGFGGFYIGTTSAGQWAAGHVSGPGQVTLMAQEFPIFTAMLDNGRFETQVQGCTIRGQVSSRGIRGTARCGESLGFDLTRTDLSGPSSMFAGIFEQSGPSSSIEAFLTPTGEVFFNLFDHQYGDNDSGSGSIDSTGEFRVTSVFGGEISGTAVASSGSLSGTYELPGEPPSSFNLTASNGQVPMPLGITASQDQTDKVHVVVETPRVVNPHGLSVIYVYFSFTDQFADARRIGGLGAFPIVIGGLRGGPHSWAMHKHSGYNQSGFGVSSDLIHAPRLYFWATIATEDGESLPVGPAAGWASNRDTVPTIYMPRRVVPAGWTLAEVPSGARVGLGLLRATANLPGQFTFVPPKDTDLPDGQHTIDVTFVPEVPGYSPVMQQFQVTVGG